MFQLRAHFADSPSSVVMSANDAPSSIVNNANGTTAAWVAALRDTWSSPVYTLLRTASFAASTYHGYKRNKSIGWAIWWGAMGALFPVVTPVIALAQGFGKAK